MNISATSTKFNPNITTTNTTKSNTDSKSFDATVEDNTAIDKEQDAILYKQLKAAGVDLTNFSFEFQKEHLISFPPLTAPGAVRKAYNTALANVTPQEKKAIIGMSFYMTIYNKQTGTKTNLDNSVDGYLDLTNNFKGYFTQYQSALGDTEFNSINNFLDSFTSELSKYKS